MTTPKFPDVARWLPSALPTLQRNIVIRALADDGITEIPAGSNRSQVIDSYADRWGSPRGSAWCALALGSWWDDVGAEVPPAGVGEADAWRRWAIARGLFTHAAQEGYAVLYGTNGRVDHVGCVTRLTPIALNVEGNTSATGYSREGVICAQKPVWAGMVLGYVIPVAKGAAT